MPKWSVKVVEGYPERLPIDNKHWKYESTSHDALFLMRVGDVIATPITPSPYLQIACSPVWSNSCVLVAQDITTGNQMGHLCTGPVFPPTGLLKNYHQPTQARYRGSALRLLSLTTDRKLIFFVTSQVKPKIAMKKKRFRGELDVLVPKIGVIKDHDVFIDWAPPERGAPSPPPISQQSMPKASQLRPSRETVATGTFLGLIEISAPACAISIPSRIPY